MSSRDSAPWIWAEALALLRNAERWQSRFVALDAARGIPCWEPAIDLYAQGDELTLVVALPGVRAEHIEVLSEAAALIIRGRRPIPPALKRAAIWRLEIPYGRFERRITLPHGNFALHKQTLEDGCLVLVLRGG